jgi:hypothetical protein
MNTKGNYYYKFYAYLAESNTVRNHILTAGLSILFEHSFPNHVIFHLRRYSLAPLKSCTGNTRA